MFSLEDNPRYQKDCKRFTQAVENIKDPKTQAYFRKVFAEFTALASIINNNHDIGMNQKIEPMQIRDDVKQLQDLRYQLDKLAKDSINS
jgi:hypothetical protein